MIKAVIFDMYETLITQFNSPVYFGTQMAADAGISEDRFQSLWLSSEQYRTTGKIALEEIIEKILRENDCYSEEMCELIVSKRVWAKKEAFNHLHKQIIPMLDALKERNILIGLISNCFSEEITAIKESVLFPYFDAYCLSYEEGICKPDEEIFKRCVGKLHVKPEECLYVGDGGSNELEAAEKLGMKTVQAVWYLRDDVDQPTGRKSEFRQIDTPLDILKVISMEESYE